MCWFIARVVRRYSLIGGFGLTELAVVQSNPTEGCVGTVAVDSGTLVSSVSIWVGMEYDEVGLS